MDTARSVVDALFAGLLLDLPDLHLVLAHAGGALTAPGGAHHAAGGAAVDGESARAERRAAAGRRRARCTWTLPSLAVRAASGRRRTWWAWTNSSSAPTTRPQGLDTIDATLAGLEATLDEHERARVEAAFVRLIPRAAARAARLG